jgi:hypothetical protein
MTKESLKRGDSVYTTEMRGSQPRLIQLVVTSPYRQSGEDNFIVVLKQGCCKMVYVRNDNIEQFRLKP